MAKVLGYWKLETNENWDEYLQTLGINYVLRKVANSITSHLELSQKGDDWTVAITSTFRSKTTNFKLGVEYDEESMDGRPVRSTIVVDGDKLVHTQIAKKDGAFNTSVTRELVDQDTLHETFRVLNSDHTARRIYKRTTKE